MNKFDKLCGTSVAVACGSTSPFDSGHLPGAGFAQGYFVPRLVETWNRDLKKECVFFFFFLYYLLRKMTRSFL